MWGPSRGRSEGPEREGYLRKGTLLGQRALVHVLQKLLEGVPHGGVSPLLGRQILQLRATRENGGAG